MKLPRNRFCDKVRRQINNVFEIQSATLTRAFSATSPASGRGEGL